MRIRVQWYAAARQLAAAESTEFELPDPATVADLRAAVAVQCPRLAAIARNLLFAVRAEYAGDETPLVPGAEVVGFPPVSGG
jgi:molybdopterin converting factor small subunit